MTDSKDLLDEFLECHKRPEDLLGGTRLMNELLLKLLERMQGGELAAHIGYEEVRNEPLYQTNRRCGTDRLNSWIDD